MQAGGAGDENAAAGDTGAAFAAAPPAADLQPSHKPGSETQVRSGIPWTSAHPRCLMDHQEGVYPIA